MVTFVPVTKICCNNSANTNSWEDNYSATRADGISLLTLCLQTLVLLGCIHAFAFITCLLKMVLTVTRLCSEFKLIIATQFLSWQNHVLLPREEEEVARSVYPANTLNPFYIKKKNNVLLLRAISDDIRNCLKGTPVLTRLQLWKLLSSIPPILAISHIIFNLLPSLRCRNHYWSTLLIVLKFAA